MKVLITETISKEGVNPLSEYTQVDVRTGLSSKEIIAIIGDYEALIVRSQTQVTADIIQAGEKLQVIARGGVGVDNIDIEAATRHGIVVVNAPTGNTVSAAEHAISLMFSLARYIPQANALLKSGVWQRVGFTGTEIKGKTLGIIGLGNVGSEVARRAQAMEMRLLGYDPFISAVHAQKIKVESVELEKLLKEADFITLHVPSTASTKSIIGEKELAMVKPTVRIVNAARGGLVDEEALVKAVREKRVAGAAFDVFADEPTTKSVLFGEDNIIVTPHLGASTAEAQVTVAKDIAQQVIDVLQGQPARYAVNAPFIPVETLATLAPFMKTAATISKMVSQLAEGQMGNIRIKYNGKIADYDTNILKASVLGGLLEEISEERVNMVNANLVAAKRGLTVLEQKETTCENYSSSITVEATTNTGVTTVSGTSLRKEPHIIQVDNYWMDIVPAGGYFLFVEHQDRPGMMGAVGRITGDADINISAMYVSRLKPRGQAMAVLALDEPLTEEQLKQLLSVTDIYSAKLVKL
ncbi:phosphoglycerate dehydrogenase [Chloroflexota bacterium]